MRQLLHWFAWWHIPLTIGGLWAAAVALDRASRLVKRWQGRTIGWPAVQDRLTSKRGTLVYMDSGVFASVWWTPDEEELRTSVDALERAVRVRCPFRFRKPARVAKLFPGARVVAFDRSLEFVNRY
jgi:hypothetical protein